MSSILILLFLAVTLAELLLEWLNLNHLRRYGSQVPRHFEAAIDPATLARSADYTVAQKRVGIFESVLQSGLVLIFLFGGILPWYANLVGRWSASFILEGVLFFLGLIAIRSLLDIPFSLVRTFRIEARYGFNTTTPGLWIQDKIKELLLSLALFGLLIAGALWLVQASPERWWIWVWAFLALFTLLLMFISPYLIEPLFFKFEPLRREGLEEGVRDLMRKAGLEAGRVFQVNASRRSRHSNAYFTGLGRVKRIVLFDTLLEQMDDREILAVLAHEIGHWKKRHIFKRLLGVQALMLFGLWVSFLLLQNDVAADMIGVEQLSFAAQALVLMIFAGVVAFPLTPLGSWLSRRHEWEADRFASDLTGRPHDLGAALVKMARENLANLHPHPLYAWFYFSHPPLAIRVERLLHDKRGDPEN